MNVSTTMNLNTDKQRTDSTEQTFREMLFELRNNLIRQISAFSESTESCDFDDVVEQTLIRC
ncbi:hypothetical protein FACS189490_05420 [Clostridia bacterium]|nr:hypothetical protein FACS189490_05420 [Clostridia bacterium]